MLAVTDKVEGTPLQKTERICGIIKTICYSYNDSLLKKNRAKIICIIILVFSIVFLFISLGLLGKSIVPLIIALVCVLVSILAVVIMSKLLRGEEHKRKSMVASVLCDSGITELYTVGSEHKIYTASFIDVDLLDGEVSLFLTELEKVPLDCIFVDKVEAAYYLYKLEAQQRKGMSAMIGSEAVKLLFSSKSFATWMKEYLDKIHYFTRFYKRDVKEPVLKTERDFSGYLSWLYKNKLTETRTMAMEYEPLIKGILKYSDYIGGCCLVCNSGNCELKKRY